MRCAWSQRVISPRRLELSATMQQAAMPNLVKAIRRKPLSCALSGSERAACSGNRSSELPVFECFFPDHANAIYLHTIVGLPERGGARMIIVRVRQRVT